VRVRGPVKVAAHLAFGHSRIRTPRNAHRLAILLTEPLVAAAAGGRREGFCKRL